MSTYYFESPKICQIIFFSNLLFLINVNITNKCVICDFYPSLKMRVKVISVNMKSGTMRVKVINLIKGEFSYLPLSWYHYSSLPPLKEHFQKYLLGKRLVYSCFLYMYHKLLFK